jgi:hypothetical protein
LTTSTSNSGPAASAGDASPNDSPSVLQSFSYQRSKSPKKSPRASASPRSTIRVAPAASSRASIFLGIA